MRTGDAVLHRPSGEIWVVAYVDGEYMSWCGWPPGEAKVADCTVTRECSDKEHRDWLTQIFKSFDYDDKRGRMAKAALASLPTE